MFWGYAEECEKLALNKAAVDEECAQYRIDTDTKLGRLKMSLDDETEHENEEEKTKTFVSFQKVS